MIHRILLIICLLRINIACGFAQTPDVINLNLIDSVDISSVLSPLGNGVYRPDVVAIKDTLFLVFGTKPQFQFHLIKLKPDVNLTPISSTRIDLFSGNHDNAIDIRISKDNSSFWYAFEDFDINGGVANSHFLNTAWYSLNGKLIDSVTKIATGVITVIPQAFSVDSSDVPPNPEAVDDPTPFYYNKVYYVLTRAWSGWIPAFTPNTKQRVRVFDEHFEYIDSFILNLATVVPDRTLSQNTLIEINGQVCLIGGFCIAEYDRTKGSYIYAIPLTSDLKNVADAPIPLIETTGHWTFKVTAARIYNNLLFINYQKYSNNRSIQSIAVFSINNNYSLIKTIEISNCPLNGPGSIFANHTTFEIVNNLLFVFYPESYDRIFAKVYEIISTTSVENEEKNTPQEFLLFQNYPNPFNPLTIINYQLPINGYITLKVYDVLGREIATLVNEEKPAGTYQVNFDGSKLSGGVYFYQLRSAEFIQTKKMLITK